MSAPTTLRHLHLPHITPYLPTARLAHHLITAHLSHKSTPSLTPPAQPTIITATFPPTYTLGRRDRLPPGSPALATLRTELSPAQVIPTLRGGQTTFHGPGQVVAYPILDLIRHRLSPRCYVDLLESTTIRTLATFGVRAERAPVNPGVYVGGEKICSVGVRVRRGVTGHGVGVNVDMDRSWWGRIEVCGIPGMTATDLSAQGVQTTVEEVGRRWVAEFAAALKLQVEPRGLTAEERASMETPMPGEDKGEI